MKKFTLTLFIISNILLIAQEKLFKCNNAKITERV